MMNRERSVSSQGRFKEGGVGFYERELSFDRRYVSAITVHFAFRDVSSQGWSGEECISRSLCFCSGECISRSRRVLIEKVDRGVFDGFTYMRAM